MAFEVFAAVDWFDSPAGRVAVIPRDIDYDPAPLVGQVVTINGVSYYVLDTLNTVNPATFGLVVSQPGLPDPG